MKRRITAGVLVACMAVSMAGCSAGGSGDAKSADTEAAQRVYLSPSYLSRIFKEKNGEGFAELLLRTRMEKACEMLEDCKYRSYDIAFYLGYDNPKKFFESIGLTNLDRRLRLRYPEENGLQIDSYEGIGSIVSFTVPFW